MFNAATEFTFASWIWPSQSAPKLTSILEGIGLHSPPSFRKGRSIEHLKASIGLVEVVERMPVNDAIAVADRACRAAKAGGGINVKQQIMPHLGFFLRASMADGRYETVDYTDVDRSVSFGLVGGGDLWGHFTIEDGVVCDATLLAAPGIVAAGDVAEFPSVEGADAEERRHAARPRVARGGAVGRCGRVDRHRRVDRREHRPQ